MDLAVSVDTRGDRAAAIYRALLSALRDGRLRPGDRLPPTRSLAGDLGVSRNTVATAYDRLTAEGYLEGRVGAGTFVTSAAASPTAARGRRKPATLRPRADWTYSPARTSSADERPRYDFRVGIPDAELFPFDTWRRLMTAELRLRANGPGSYAEPSGHLGLREAIARYVGYSRSVHAEVDDVIVTNGTQQGLDLVGRVMLAPGDVVAVEEPGYPPARLLFASLGARVVGVPVDAEGLDIAQLPERARLVYTTPSHQFPLGIAMSLARRRALLAWASERGAAIIEDDYDSEFRFTERPLEPLHSLDQTGRVIYAGTFSKTLLPSLRIGYLVAPPSLRSALRAARQLSDSHGPMAPQAALARFMDEGLLARHIRRASKAYAVRHELLVRGLAERLGDLVEPVPSAAGLHVAARLRDGMDIDTTGAVRQAGGEGIALDALPGYCAGAAQEGLVFGYGAVVADSIGEGLARLSALLRRAATKP